MTDATRPRALVTGAAGFIGSHLTAGLLDAGYSVIGLDNFSSGDPERLDPFRPLDRFEFVEGDVTDGTLLRELLGSVDHVFHQAARVSVPESFDTLRATSEVNCTGTATLLAAARDAGVDTAVVASSAAVYGSEVSCPVAEDDPLDPESPYALSKLWTEQLALQVDGHADLDAVALRYFNVFGPGQDADGEYASVVPAFVDRIAAGEPPVIYGDGHQSRDFVYVDDVVRANLAVADADVGGTVFNVARGERTTIRELAAYVSDALGADVEPIYEDPRPGDVRHSWADVSRLEEAVGITPSVGVREGIERTVSRGIGPKAPTEPQQPS